jgi:uncharacterized protein YfaP (DUF2135 family)
MKRLTTYRITAALLFGSVCASTAHATDIDFTAPLNGWRNTSGDTARYAQDVHYPAVAVATPEGQSVNAMIAGHVKGAPKQKQKTSVATMVVNGTPLPQRVEEDGSFSRPYAFAGGSNSVEVRAADGTAKRVQFYDAYSGKTRPRLRVVLAWDTDGTDLDLHVVSPDGAHTFYGDRVAPNGGALDVDVTTGYGPEIYSSAAPLHGTYLVYVNYYGSGNSSGGMTVAQVSIITDENTPNEKSETIRVPMRKAGELTLVKTFVMP